MRFSLDWLKDHVDIDVPVEQMSDRLTAVGFAVEGVEAYGDDTLLDVEVTTNRPDCMNHRGLAREIAAALRKPLKPLDVRLTEASKPAAEVARIEIDEPTLCSRYTARVILGVKDAASPPWVEKRLRAVGINPKSAVVDASNFVLWDLGHPLHVFDLSKLEENMIRVRLAARGERLLTVADEKQHALERTMLVIADASRPVAVAGVMGGLESGVANGTTDLLIESAWFDPVSVRRTARSLGMHTDASHRFERGADPDITRTAADRLCRMILELAGGECLSGSVDAVAREHPKRTAVLRRKRLDDVLGTEVPGDTVTSSLEALEICLVAEGSTGWSASLPPHRPDLAAEEDLIEEVARSIGYDSLPSTLPTKTTLPAGRLAGDDRDAALRETLAHAGFCEIIGYAMVGRAEDESFAPDGEPPAVEITNPLSERWEVMRRSIFPGLLRIAAHNIRHGQRDLALFEVGTIFHRSQGTQRTQGTQSGQTGGLPREERVVGLAGTGAFGPPHWDAPARTADVFDLTGAAGSIARAYRAGDVSIRPGTRRFLHPKQAFEVSAGGRDIGFGGVLLPHVADEMELPRETVVAQFSLTTLAGLDSGTTQFRPLPKLPAVSRDVSAIVAETTAWSDVESAASTALSERGELSSTATSVRLADRYAGKPLPADRISLTLNIHFQPRERTLTTEEIDAAVECVVKALQEKTGAEIRR